MRDFHLPGRSGVFASNGICATSHPLAAKVAVSTLENGGNAVDAAIAGAVLLGLCEPAMTGIGGDCFALIHDPARDDIVAVNGSGRAPAGLSAAALRAQGHGTMPLGHPASVTLPGAVDAFCRMSADFGRLGLDAVLAPTIRYAEEGVPVAPRAGQDWAQNAAKLQGHAREVYLMQGRAPGVGQLFRAPGQAEVLRRVAAQGRDGFYTGEVAEDMVASLRAMGGTHELADFAAVQTSYHAPISGSYKGIELVEHPPNGQGATAILINAILAQFDLAAMAPFGADRAHLEAEAVKLAYGLRDRILADGDHTTRLEEMLSPETARTLAGRIDMARAGPAVPAPAEARHSDTIYITVVDRDRMAVSLIYSIFKDFGSGIASDRFGILMHNRGGGFTLEAGHPNEAAGGKRPLHTILPAMLRKDGKLTMSFGVMGGQYQANGHARFVTNVVDYGMDPQAAIDAPRSFSDAGAMKLENGYAPEVRAQLSARGHKVVTPDTAIGGAQAIALHESGVLEGGSDPRKDGCALGY